VGKTPIMSSVIYLDNNATTQVAPEVFEAMVPWLRDGYGNPSSVYRLGRQASAALDEARERIAALAGCQDGEIIFTSCGTESINTAILSALAMDPDKRHIITSSVEHSATVKLCEHLAQRGYEITWLPVDAEGLLDPADLDRAITDETAIVSLMWANNETGVVFPIEEISAITRRKKTLLHLDAVQAFGKVQISLEKLGVEFVSFSGHKIYAPKGVGALYANRRVRYTPLLRGSQEEGRRGGTQNVASIVAFGKAAELAGSSMIDGTVKALRDRLESRLLEAIPGVSRNGHADLRLPNTSNLSFDGIESEAALILLDERGVCCSAGSACSSGSVHPSHVLKAMGLSNDMARASLRFSVGRLTSELDIDIACEVIPAVISRIREMSPVGSPVLTN
jgi:cysteine desulfurase